MKVTITARHIEIPASVIQMLELKAEKLEKFGHKLIDLHAIFDKEKYNYTAELTLFAKGITVIAKAKDSKDLLTCVEEALTKVREQLRHHESKLAGKRRRLRRSKETVMADLET